MENRKKIAICLSGGIKHPEKSINSINSHFKEFDVKIFTHTWEIKDRAFFNKHSWNGMGDVCTSSIPDSIDEVRKFLNFEKIKIENFESLLKYFEKIKQNFHLFSDRKDVGPISMFYSLSQCDSLRVSYEMQNDMKFDYVIRMRFDSDIKNIDVSNIENNFLHIPNENDWNGINDQFAYGDSDTMRIYSSIFLNLSKLNDCVYNPEVLLKKYVLMTGLSVKRTNAVVKIGK